MLVEFAPGEQRNSPRFEKVRRYIMTRRSNALFYRRQITIAPCIQRSIAAIQWNVAANGSALDAGNIAERV